MMGHLFMERFVTVHFVILSRFMKGYLVKDILLVNVTFLERTFCDGMFHNGLFSVFFTN